MGSCSSLAKSFTGEKSKLERHDECSPASLCISSTYCLLIGCLYRIRVTHFHCLFLAWCWLKTGQLRVVSWEPTLLPLAFFLSLMSLPVEVKLAAVSEADFAPGHFCVIQCGSPVSVTIADGELRCGVTLNDENILIRARAA